MRNLYFFLIMAFSTECFSQSYIPMLGETSNTWHAVSCFGGCGIDSYGTAGDTIIDGYEYRVLGGYHYIQGNFLIREDVQERKVYMKLLGGHVLLDEYPLYDFSLSVGDTTHVYNPISPLPEDGGLFVLDSIVAIPLETGNHRFFYLHAVDPIASVSPRTVWVEGVGALSLINSPGQLPNEEDHLGCAFKDGVLQYADTDSIGSCSNINSVAGTEEPRPAVYPTIFKNVLNIDIGRFSNSSVRILTVNGALAFKQQGSNGGTLVVAGSKLPYGVLLVEVIVDGVRYVSKVIHIN